MVTDKFSIVVQADDGVYECKVRELQEYNETYYELDILSPRVRDRYDHIHQNIHHVEMRIDCDSEHFKIKVFNEPIPAELLKIEQQLSDAICKRQL